MSCEYGATQAENEGYDKMASMIKIHLKNGKVITGRAEFGKGSPSDPPLLSSDKRDAMAQ
jgi:hypothetical protein